MSEIKDFCIKSCPLGITKSEEFLDKNSSAYDAAMDMRSFIENCSKTCPYKDRSCSG